MVVVTEPGEGMYLGPLTDGTDGAHNWGLIMVRGEAKGPLILLTAWLGVLSGGPLRKIDSQ